MDVFYKFSSQDEVAEAGEKFLLALYNAESHGSLNKYRGVNYKRRVAKMKLSNQFKLETLPPTSEAARQHSMRTYLQVQTWLGNHTLPATEWGWKLRHNILEPVRTNKAIAHPKLMNLVSCSCKKGCKGSCTCRKMGLSCTDMCGKCSEVGCSNVTMEEDSTNETFYDQTSENNFEYNTSHQANRNFADEPISNALYDSIVMLDS